MTNGTGALRLHLRTADARDDGFLMELFASTREAELALLDAPHREDFLRMQFRIRAQQYRASYPSAADKLILLDDEPIGRMLVDRNAEAMTLVDIALFSQFRCRGIGTQSIRELMSEADRSGLPLQLHVYKSSPAVRLYDRLGFALAGNEGMYLNLCYRGAPDDG